ncbi:hypothetical protein D3C78_908550 [compost metagenome]
MQADHVLRAAGDGGDGVDIQGRGVAGEDGAGLAHLVEGAEHLLLDRQVLEHGLDHQVGVGQVGVVEGALQQFHALLQLRFGQLAALDADLVVLADLRQAAIQRLGLLLQQLHRNADVGEVHGDAAAHGAGADHRDLADRAERGSGIHSRNPSRFAFGEEHMALGNRLRGALGLPEQLALAGQAFVQRQRAGGLYRGQYPIGRLAVLPARLVVGQIALDEVVGHAVCRVRPGLRPARRGAMGEQFAGKGAGRIQQVLSIVADAVQQAQLQGATTIDGLAGDHHFQRRLDADQPWQALGATGAGQQAEIDFRQGKACRGLADAIAAGQRQLQSATHGDTADRRQQRLVQARHAQ